jgi:hypothetical protein
MMVLYVVVPADEFEAAKRMAARGIPFAHEKTVWRGPGAATIGLVGDHTKTASLPPSTMVT